MSLRNHYLDTKHMQNIKSNLKDKTTVLSQAGTPKEKNLTNIVFVRFFFVFLSFRTSSVRQHSIANLF